MQIEFSQGDKTWAWRYTVLAVVLLNIAYSSAIGAVLLVSLAKLSNEILFASTVLAVASILALIGMVSCYLDSPIEIRVS